MLFLQPADSYRFRLKDLLKLNQNYSHLTDTSCKKHYNLCKTYRHKVYTAKEHFSLSRVFLSSTNCWCKNFSLISKLSRTRGEDGARHRKGKCACLSPSSYCFFNVPGAVQYFTILYMQCKTLYKMLFLQNCKKKNSYCFVNYEINLGSYTVALL